jgi:PadR family transcriptional regulator, regulatory protein PadR
MKKTHSLIEVARAIMKNPYDKHWGYELSDKTGLKPGTLSPILARLREAGWLIDVPATQWEPRRIHEVTELGRKEMTELLEEKS